MFGTRAMIKPPPQSSGIVSLVTVESTRIYYTRAISDIIYSQTMGWPVSASSQ
jgi:hypothetical protein